MCTSFNSLFSSCKISASMLLFVSMEKRRTGIFRGAASTAVIAIVVYRRLGQQTVLHSVTNDECKSFLFISIAEKVGDLTGEDKVDDLTGDGQQASHRESFSGGTGFRARRRRGKRATRYRDNGGISLVAADSVAEIKGMRALSATI